MNDQLLYYKSKLKFEMDPADLFEAITNGEKVIPVDARKTHGFETEHIPGAINIPYRNMDEAATGHLDKEALYVTYCDGIGCNASTKGAIRMTELGFYVKELIGGIEWWKHDGYATEGNDASAGVQLRCHC